ncbi:GNAT family N-acetyltransferase [Paenibacillus sp. N3.4]|uniref:GNAT family N-acetyltransferase n=1 Tax=Paenibacillus sp. N3.4 TaxID=2603222 RepID=UPI0011CC4E49|nr:GNAT family protein [Paenibacillus sp. N3.4]TXK75145.1 GNAT family N-acetyltransferase [Paenibacillus sp. N3.4]
MDFPQLEGKRISLLPLELEHTDALFQCSRSLEIWEYLPIKIQTVHEMERFVQSAISERECGADFPYVVFDKKLNKIVGMTRYLRISHVHKNLNIGWTWYSPEVWRTAVNTECKYLLFKHAFEVWEAVRVEFVAASTNYRSQTAIERLGAKKEGILRKKYNATDHIVYSIIDEDWNDIKNRLERFLEYSR